MKIGVIGARDRFDEDWIFNRLDEFVKKDDTIVSGGASGVDTYAEHYAKIHDLNFLCFHPQEEDTKKGLNAYVERDRRIAENSDVLLAFPSQHSVGTWTTVNIARKLNQRVVIFEFEKEKNRDE